MSHIAGTKSDSDSVSHGLDSDLPGPSLSSPSEQTNEGRANGFTLPTFDPSSIRAGEQEPPPPHTAATVGSHGNASDRQGDDSDSSNWSSSEDEGEGGGGGLMGQMKPSTHSTLIAEWEWRAMNKDTTR